MLVGGAGLCLVAINYVPNYRHGKSGFNYLNETLQKSDYYYPVQGKNDAKNIADQACRLNIYCIDAHRRATEIVK